VADPARSHDALHGRTRHLPLPVESLAPGGKPRTPGAALHDYAAAWHEAEEGANRHLAAALDATEEMFEGRVARHLALHLPENTPVFVASSMPVRDVEYFWPHNARRTAVYFNRGANGIDGTLSTALGIAQASDHPAVLLTGDLAFLHDSNGLMLASKLHGGLTVVLINNHGGGIFEHLPVAQFDPPYEEFFATPQQVAMASLCVAHGVAHVTVRDWIHFSELISTLPLTGVRVLEVGTDRKRDAAARKRLLNSAGRSMS